jgi:predicted PurR-regulated permease PerM
MPDSSGGGTEPCSRHPSEDDIAGKARKAQQVLERSSTNVVQVCVVILTLLAVLYTLYLAAVIVLPFILAVVLALVLGPAMHLLSRRLRIPRAIAALMLIVALISMVGGLGFALSVPASGWIARAPESIPRLIEKLNFLQKPILLMERGMHQLEDMITSAPGGTPSAGQLPPTMAAPQSPDMSGSIVNIGSSVLERGRRAFLGGGFTLMLLLFFFLASSDTLLRRIVEILPHFDEKRRVISIVAEIERNISRYLLTITLMNVMVGLLAGLTVWLLGMPDPLLFGTLAFLLNYIPIIGPAIGVTIYFFVGIFTFPSILEALVPAAIYLGIHVMEGETITPMLLARRFTLNPIMVISSLMFWDWLWGIPGALLSMPLLAVTKIVCDHIDALTPLGHLLGGSSTRSRSG